MCAFFQMNLLSGREDKDEKDGETFGFTECPRLETAEGERRGRGKLFSLSSSMQWRFPSFHFIIVVSSHKSLRISLLNSNVPFSESPEWTGKEHKNGDQENRKNISDEHKENLDPDVATLLDDFRTEKRLFNKSTQSEECALSSTPSDASPCSSTPRTIISKLLPHELTSKSPEQSLETKSNKKAKQHEVTSLQLVSDEICLPDEDSLITSDDFKLPVDLVLLPESNVTETDLFASSSRMPGNVSQMLAALKVPLDERSQSSLEVPLTCSGSDNINGLDTSHGNLRARQEFSHHSQTNQSSALFCPSDSQRARRNKFKPHLKNLSYNHPPISYIPLYVLPLDPYDASTSFDIPTMQPFPQQILVPAEFPHPSKWIAKGTILSPPQRNGFLFSSELLSSNL